MTITPKNIKSPPRTQIRKPLMSCMNTMIYFNKPAARLMNAPCKLIFDDLGENKWHIITNEDGFALRQKGTKFFIGQYARPLIKKLEIIFNRDKPKFIIRTSGNDHVFELTLIQ